MNRWIATAVFLVALAGGFYLFTAAPVAEVNFSEEGAAVQNSPGLPAGIWHLVYEKPGAPALTVALIFGDTPIPALEQGQRVRVEGTLKDSVVTVRSITPVQPQP